jgi:hypothetical protein
MDEKLSQVIYNEQKVTQSINGKFEIVQSI